MTTAFRIIFCGILVAVAVGCGGERQAAQTPAESATRIGVYGPRAVICFLLRHKVLRPAKQTERTRAPRCASILWRGNRRLVRPTQGEIHRLAAQAL